MNRLNKEQALYVIRIKCYVCFSTHNNLLSHLNNVRDNLITSESLYRIQCTQQAENVRDKSLTIVYTFRPLYDKP
jgi:hypothetical protein